MADKVQYLVNFSGAEANVSVLGRASYLNCMQLGKFFDFLAAKKCRRLNVDFYACTGMDSTFMGMLAGITLRLAEPELNGEVVLYNLSGRNLELIENLGLDNILKISSDAFAKSADAEALEQSAAGKNAMLEAHQNLVEAHPQNLKKFEDVIKFLKERES